jgi:hypothetical protein
MSKHPGALTSAAAVDAPYVPEVAGPTHTDVVPFHFVQPAVFAADLILVTTLSVLSGVGYHWIFLNTVPGLETFLAVGVLIFSNFSAILVARGDYRTYNLVNFRRQARDVTLTWTAVFLVILGVAFSLKGTSNNDDFVVGLSAAATDGHFRC